MGLLSHVHEKTPIGIFGPDATEVAYRLLSGALPGGMGMPPTRGTAEYLRAYSQMPWLRAVASRIATAVARVEWQLYVIQGTHEPKARHAKAIQHIQRAGAAHRRRLLKQAAGQQELKQIVDHPLLDVMHNANEFQTGYGMRKVTQLHIDIVGDAFWLKERDAQGTVTAVWPVPPHWIMATPTPAFKFYRVSFRAWRGIIPDTEFVWFSDDDPMNPYGRGSGAAMALGDELETDEYAARYSKSFFYNSGRPDLLVWPKGQGTTDANVRRLEEDWLSRAEGFFRSFKPFFLSREVEVKALDTMGNFRSQQLVQLREFERNACMQFFGIPPEVMGVLEHSNRSTIDAADYLMARYVLEPRLEFQRTTLQERFVPEYDDRLIVEYVNPAIDDKDAQLKAAEASPWALTVDEWRRLAGQAPLEDVEAGTLHLVPFNLTPQSLSSGGAQPSGTVEPVPTQPGEGRRAMDRSGSWRAEVRADLTVAAAAGDSDLASQLARALGDDGAGLPVPSAVAAKLEPGISRALVRAWRDHAARMNRATLASAIRSGLIGDVLRAMDVPALGAAQTGALQPLLVRAMLQGAHVGASALLRQGVSVRTSASSAAKAAPLAVDLAGVNPAVTAWAQQHAGVLVQGSAEAKAAIAALVARANAEGIPPDRLAREIQDVVGLTDRQVEAVERFRDRLLDDEEVSDADVDARVARYAAAQQRARALTIARTETIGAVNAGQQALWDQAVEQGVIQADQFEKVWITAEDELVEEECESLAGERVGIDEAFSSGDDYPPAHVNCRCAVGLEPAEGAEKGARRAPRSMPTIEIHNHLAPTRTIDMTYDAHGRLASAEIRDAAVKRDG